MNAHTNIGTTQRMSAILSQVAVIVDVRSTALGLYRLDKQAGIDSDVNKHARIGTAKTSACRLPGAEGYTKDINRARAEYVNVVKAMTTAWNDRRLLPNSLIQRLLQGIGPVKQEYERLVQSFLDAAPRLIANAPGNLGDYAVDPPTLEECQGAFTISLTMEQIPDSANYTATGVDKAVEDELKRRFEMNIEAAYQQAQNDALLRVQKPLANLVERMTIYDKREEEAAKGIETGRQGYFRDSIINNITEIAAVFDSFNLTNNPDLKVISQKLAAFEGIEAEDLRKSKSLRDDTAKRAQDILDSLGGWL